jgi:uncharacterized surface protein with fasciclin (FAS1) repeats
MIRRITTLFTAVALSSSALVAATAPANAAAAAPGTQSLAEVLAADGSGFDRKARDFDILDNAVGAVLAAKPNSPVAVLADGNTKLTAFAPTDAAFRRLVADLTGKSYPREKRVFRTLAGAAGIDTIEDVLLYHVVPGAKVTYKMAKQADGAKLETALGKKLTVKVNHEGRVVLRDADRNDKNAKVIPALRNLNRGNKQLAHGIDQVLRPINL